MFAYCLNNPAVYVDERGYFPGIVDELFTMREKQDNVPGLGENLFLSMSEAAIAAGTSANLLTAQTDMEYACGIYETEFGGRTFYYYGNLHKGTHSSADPQAIIGEYSRRGSTLIALLHTHSNCTGHDNLFFSIYRGEKGAFGGDAGVVQEYGYPLYLARYDGWLLCLTLKGNTPCTTYVAKGLPVDKTVYPCY